MAWRAAAGALVVAALLPAFDATLLPAFNAAMPPALDAAVQSPGAVVRLASVRALPAHLAGEFEEPAGFAMQPDGRYFVFDRRRHGVFAVDAARTTVTRVVDIGSETGRLLRPRAFDVHADGRFVVADAPGLRPRVSVFRPDGGLFNYFEIGGTSRPRVAIGNVVLNGIASTRLLDDTVLFSLPEQGGLVSEYSLAGTPVRSFGELRATGHEDDRDVHLALNAALPVPAPDGHVYVVFLAGVPAFRKYAPDGRLVYERVVQSRMLDPHVQTLPTAWPLRSVDGLTFPMVVPMVRTAAVDPQGRLWIATLTSHVYVFDADGEKVATYQLTGAGPILPESLWFTGDGRLLVSPGLYEFELR